MRDPMTWSFPLGRMFGIAVRVHVLLPLVMLGLILRALTHEGSTVSLGEAGLMMVLLFVSILLHEFGHCFAARSVDGDASEVLLWPLGGLAYCDLPHTPRAHLITAMGGPAVNLLLCVVAGGALSFAGFGPPWHPLKTPSQPELTYWRTGDKVSRTGVTSPKPVAEVGPRLGFPELTRTTPAPAPVVAATPRVLAGP